MHKLRRRGVVIVSLLIPGLSLLAGGVSQAAAQAPAPHSATAAAGHQWCDPLKVFLPKASFRPLRASAAQLKANGFPARPPTSDPGALAEWKQIVEHAKHFTVPHPVCGTTKHSDIYNGYWAGHLVPKSDYSDSSVVQTEAQWTQPSVPGDSNYPNWQTAPDTSFWDGIGLATLMQAGCDSIASSTPTYKCWTEDYPQNTIWEGPAAHPGDLMLSEVSYLGGNITYYLLENETAGTAESFDNATPDVGSNSADFINERIGGRYLPKFGTVRMSGNKFWQANNTEHDLTTTNVRYDMTSNCKSSGTPLVNTGSVSGGAFSLTWESASPFTNGC